MPTNNLIIVESPTKAKTISRFLGKPYTVMSSYGHIRDLPKSQLGIDVDHDFTPHYVISPKAKPNVTALKNQVKNSDLIYLATDEDREGEAIAWHLMEVLKLKPEYTKRIVFHEITQEAIEHALREPRALDTRLVKAQETRRLLDRLYGYSVSPVLWRKIKPGLSAGRVQSVAVKLLVEREKQRLAFISAGFWDVLAVFTTTAEHFSAQLTNLNNQPIASGKDFDATGQLKNKRVACLNQDQVEKLVKELHGQTGIVTLLDSKPFTENPLPPFTTSTLQQEANRKLKYSAKRTMQLAQSLYEQGYITYMRTDSTLLSQQAITAARQWIKEQYGDRYLSPQPRQYQTKSKNAQEAHEAIRPAGSSFQPLAQVKNQVDDDAFKLYELIWKRTVASQMAHSQGTRLTVEVTVRQATFTAKGKTFNFDGYRRAYVEGSDDPEAELNEQEAVLPPLKLHDKINIVSLTPKGHTTQPPPRLTEATLVKELEQRGIGRPSTYASIIETILRRDYVTKKGTALIPTFTAFAVTGLLEKYLTNLVDYNFTAQMEDKLDDIALGQADDKTYLKEFYYGNGQDGLLPTLEHITDKIDPRLTSGITIGRQDGQPVEVRIGRFGPFIRWQDKTASLPVDISPDELTLSKALDLLAHSQSNNKELGVDPQSGLIVFLKIGRFGPYVQLGETPQKTGDKAQDKLLPKPKMASLFKDMSPDSITLDQALQLLSLPRTVGINPTNNEPIVAASGRFGPYIKCGTDTRSLNNGLTPLNITLEQALELLAQPKTSRQRGATAIKELGNKPNGPTIKLMNGRYGLYVTDGTTNATLPKDETADTITLTKAMELIQEREGKHKKAKRSRHSKKATA